MAYASWSVVFGEQPSAAKWNILGTNDASFNDGTGIGTGVITPAKRSGGFYMSTIAGATVGSTGNKAITGVGFTPKFVFFTVLFSASSTVASSAIGGMTALSQWTTWASANSAGNTSSRSNVTTRCIGWGSPGASTFDMSASYVSFDADGFTINVNTASSTFDIGYIAYG